MCACRDLIGGGLGEDFLVPPPLKFPGAAIAKSISWIPNRTLKEHCVQMFNHTQGTQARRHMVVNKTNTETKK